MTRSYPSNYTPQVSHRGGTLLAGAVGLLLLRFVGTGKAGNAWTALWGPATKATGSSGTAAPSSASGGAPAATGSGPFGLSNIRATLHPTAYLQQDRGLVPDATGEVNYLLPTGAKESFDLPPARTGRLTGRSLAARSGGKRGSVP